LCVPGEGPGLLVSCSPPGTQSNRCKSEKPWKLYQISRVQTYVIYLSEVLKRRLKQKPCSKPSEGDTQMVSVYLTGNIKCSLLNKYKFNLTKSHSKYVSHFHSQIKNKTVSHDSKYLSTQKSVLQIGSRTYLMYSILKYSIIWSLSFFS
jgi:hypothetical protein